MPLAKPHRSLPPLPSRPSRSLGRPLLLALLALGGCAAPAPGQTVTLLDYQATVPASLQERPASSQMRLVEFSVPRDDDAQAEVIVYYFGAGQGGSADANIARWKGQFTSPDGGPVTPDVTTLKGASFPTTVASFQGTYARAIGMDGGAGGEPDQGLVAAIVETPRGSLFLQLHGDRKAVDAVKGDFLDMVRSIRPAGGGKAS